MCKTERARRRDAAEKRMAEGRRQNAQIAKAIGAFDRLLKLIESNPVDDPWRGNAGLALMPAQDAGRDVFGYPPLEFVRDDFSEKFKNRQELIPNASQEWLLRLNFPDGEPTAFRLYWHGELEMPPNTVPREFLRPVFARLRPDIVGCLKQWLIEFGEWRSLNGKTTEIVATSPPNTDPASTVNQDNGAGSDDHPDDELLAKYQDPLTPLGKRIVKALWTRKYAVQFDTLRDEAWQGDKVSDGGIERRLQDIEKKWTAANLTDIDLEISVAASSVKLLKLWLQIG